MKHIPSMLVFFCLLTSCVPARQESASSQFNAPSGSQGVPAGDGLTAADALEQPKIPVPADHKVLKVLSVNLDNDPEEEQVMLLQAKANLSLPISVRIADYDVQRKTYYLAWETDVLASASQPFDVRVQSLISASQQELVVRGVAESGHPSLDIFRLATAGTGLGLQYVRVFSQVSLGTIDLDTTATGFSSVPVIAEEADKSSPNPLDTVKTIWEWRFQKSRYEVVRTEHFRREKPADATLEKLFSGDTAGLEGFLQGPWVKTLTEKKEPPLLLFIDTEGRELVFATASAQEVYHWEQSTRTLRNALYISGSNDLISLIKLQINVAVTGGDAIEVGAPDGPNWSGSYTRLSDSAARALTGTSASEDQTAKAPKGLYRNDKGDQFNFQFPEVQLVLGGTAYSGFGALHTFAGTTVLQIKVPGIDGKAVLSKAYSFLLTEEPTSGRVVRTIRLQEGKLTISGWIPNSSDALRLEQVEVLSSSGNSR
ncbi:MAG: pallilysin-related adhesin [Spirochaetales bacterium]